MYENTGNKLSQVDWSQPQTDDSVVLVPIGARIEITFYKTCSDMRLNGEYHLTKNCNLFPIRSRGWAYVVAINSHCKSLQIFFQITSC